MKYQKPVVLDFDTLPVSMGSCASGASVGICTSLSGGTAGACTIGKHAAEGACAAGNTVMNSCVNGALGTNVDCANGYAAIP